MWNAFWQLKCCNHWDILFQADFNVKKGWFQEFIPASYSYSYSGIRLIKHSLSIIMELLTFYCHENNIFLTFSWDTDQATFVSEVHQFHFHFTNCFLKGPPGIPGVRGLRGIKGDMVRTILDYYYYFFGLYNM